MADHKYISAMAKTEKNKPLFLLGMIRIVDQQSVIIIKYRLSFLERYFMLFLIQYVFVGIPLKTKFIHGYIIITK